MPTVSVIVPARNASYYLKNCLDSLGLPSSLKAECIVVDDASDDDTPQIAKHFGVTYLRNDRCRGPAFSRNRGAEAASGEILLFLDADTMVHQGVLERVVRRFSAEPDLDALVGSYDNSPADPGFVSSFRNLLHCFTHQHGAIRMDTFWTGCGAIRRRAFEESGGFSSRYLKSAIEDVEFGYRLVAAGRNIELDRDLQVKHLKRWSFWSVIATDIARRGIPWALLILRTGRMPDNLVTRKRERCCVGAALLILLNSLTFAGAIAVSAVPVYSFAFAGDLLGLLAFLFLNRPVLHFFQQVCGWRFAGAVVPMLFIYHCCNLISIACAMVIYAHDPKQRVPECAPVPVAGKLEVS